MIPDECDTLTPTLEPIHHHEGPLEYIIIGIYVVAIFAIAFYQYWRDRSLPGFWAVNSYFLAGHTIPWYAVGALLFSSNIGSEHFIGLCGSAVTDGLVIGVYEWGTALLMIPFAYFFVPVYMSSKIYTAPEFIGRRFNNKLRVYISILSICLYVVTKISVTVYAGSIFLQELLHLDMWISSVVLIVVTGLYVIIGGLRAIMYTALLQTVLMIVGGSIVMGAALLEVGGYSGMKQNEDLGSDPCISRHYFNIFRPLNSPHPWLAELFGSTFTSIYYWMGDQVILQNIFGAKNERHAKAGVIFAGFLKILPVFMFVFPGMAAKVIFPELNTKTLPRAYPMLTAKLLRTGFLGLAIIGVVSATMSSLAAVYNAASAIMSFDILQHFRPKVNLSRHGKTPRQKILKAGRFFAFLMVIASVAWIPVVRTKGDMFDYIQEVQALFMCPLSAVFILGIFWTRANAFGAMTACGVGLICGCVRLLINASTLLGYKQEDLPEFAKVNYFYFGIILFFATAFVLVTMSLCTPPPHLHKLIGQTWKYRWDVLQERRLLDDGETRASTEYLTYSDDQHSDFSTSTFSGVSRSWHTSPTSPTPDTKKSKSFMFDDNRTNDPSIQGVVSLVDVAALVLFGVIIMLYVIYN